MRQQIQAGYLYTLLFSVCLFAIVVFFVGLVRAEQASAASASGEADSMGVSPVLIQEEEAKPGQSDPAPASEVRMSVQAFDEEGDNGHPGDGLVNLTEDITGSGSFLKQAQAYVTTAYYLNVRAESNAKSRILRTVKKGTILMVTEKLENGWLQLENEGYVHGAYAEPVNEEAAEPRVMVKAAALQAKSRDVFKPADLTGNTSELDKAASKFAKSGVKKSEAVSNEVISRSGLTKEDIETIFKGTQLLGHGLEEAVLEVEEQYGINAFFTIAVMKLESGNGKSRLARVKNNLFGLNATGGNNEQAYSFETKADSVYRFGKLISEKYVGKGLTTIEKVGRKYCPANDEWADLIMRIMQSDQKKI